MPVPPAVAKIIYSYGPKEARRNKVSVPSALILCPCLSKIFLIDFNKLRLIWVLLTIIGSNTGHLRHDSLHNANFAMDMDTILLLALPRKYFIRTKTHEQKGKLT